MLKIGLLILQRVVFLRMMLLFQPQLIGSLRQFLGFIRIDGGGNALADGTETALAGTHLAEDQERGGAHLPALEDVRAVGFLADSMKTTSIQQFSDSLE